MSFGLPATYAAFMYKDYIGVIFCWYILFLVFYSKFYKSYGLPYIDIISWEICIIAAFIHLGAMITCGYSFIPFLFIAIIIFYIFLHSQANLDEMLERSQKNTPMVTTIRRSNTRWFYLVMSFIFILYPLRKPLGNLLLVLIKASLLIIGYMIKFIAWLMPKAENVTMQTGETPNIFAQLAGETTSNSLWEIIFLCLIIAVIIFLRKYILACLLDIIKLIKELFVKLYQILFGLKVINKAPNLLYEETIEEVSATTTFQHKTSLLSKFKWKKQFKEFLKLPNNEAKYRFGFKLLLEGLKLKGFTFKTANTPRELISLAKEDAHFPSMDIATYEGIRYGEKTLEEGNIEELESILTALFQKK